MTVSIRDVTVDDRDVWTGLWDRYLAFYETTRNDDVKDATWGRLLDSRVPMFSCLAETADKEAVGLVNYLFHPSFWDVSDVCYLNDLYVDPDARGAGIGRALIQTVVDRSLSAGITGVYWMTAKNNSSARALYDRVATQTPFVQYVIGDV
jgi:GNAT superfamily N-acetyltransferase